MVATGGAMALNPLFAAYNLCDTNGGVSLESCCSSAKIFATDVFAASGLID